MLDVTMEGVLELGVLAAVRCDMCEEEWGSVETGEMTVLEGEEGEESMTVCDWCSRAVREFTEIGRATAASAA